MALIEDGVDDNIHHHLMSNSSRFIDSHCLLAVYVAYSACIGSSQYIP